MRAFQFMRLEGIPRQVPGVGEVLVAVKAAGVGRGTGWSAIGFPRAAAAAGRRGRLSGADRRG
jgi:NADPH:quinone reductase-like Zn-dependent oxidoreductase